MKRFRVIAMVKTRNRYLGNKGLREFYFATLKAALGKALSMHVKKDTISVHVIDNQYT